MTVVFLAGPLSGTTAAVHPATTCLAARNGLYLRDDELPIPDGHTADVAFGWAPNR
ncbi:hypothetical protein DSM104299_04251 [Baekduia alba]|uniref:hypothetical protein n=1 Tax=Baekduia alba TaxID=2997333 RepID=UPI00233FE800|nr:hypothetical protein [Baekduia alba]WCB95503.1 hypothetical protein DSM104299_04251 [Baekduia alba]